MIFLESLRVLVRRGISFAVNGAKVPHMQKSHTRPRSNPTQPSHNVDWEPKCLDFNIPLATSTTVLSGLDFCAKCDFCVKGWVRGICMWRILWFWCFLMI